MPRGQNFFYQDPTQAIGTSLAEALFGNPQKALEQQRIQAELDARAAQAERDRAAAAYDTQRTRGVGIQNDASTSLPDLLAKLYRPPVSVPSVNDPAFLDGVGTEPPVPTDTEQFAANLAPVVATLAQIQGDKVDTPETIGTLASFFGGDELARRGLIAQGHTPTADFAINSQRADEIAANDAAAKLRQALGVAEINNRDDVPVAKIQAGASNYRADRSLEGTKYSADKRLTGTEYSADAKSGQSRGIRNNNPGNLEYGSFARSMGATGSDGRFAVFPSYEAGVRAQEQLLAGSNYVGGGRNTIDAILRRYAPPSDGNNIGNYADYVSRRTGIPRNQPLRPEQVPQVAEAMRLFETGSQSPTAGKGGRGASAAPKPPKPVDAKTQKAIDTEVENQLNGATVSPRTLASIRAGATYNYQNRGGNMVEAVRNSIKAHDERRAKIKAGQAAKASGGGGGQSAGRRLSVAEAAKLPKGTRFIGMDGVERVRQ